MHTEQQSEDRHISVRLGAVSLSKRYGAVQANRNVTLSIAPNEIHAIVGENGAGKSTLMRMLQGMEQPDDGHVVLDDQPVYLTGPQDAFRLGIGMVHQEFMLAPDLTLLENLVLGDEPAAVSLGPLSRIDWGVARRDADRLAKQASIDIDWDRRAGSTPVHIRQFVEIVRLLRRGARVLILDEPTAVLAPQQVDDLIGLLKTLRDGGTTILFISHKLKEVMALADQVSVMRRGEICFSSAVAETDINTIASHVIGGNERQAAPQQADDNHETGDVVLDVKELDVPALDKSHPLHAINLEVRRGEIVGIAGVSGNGQHELIECLVGLRAASGGSVSLMGENISSKSNGDRRTRGMSYVSADRAHEGLALAASIQTNVIAGSQRSGQLKSGIMLSLPALRREALKRLKALNVVYGDVADPVSSLSGGNQQKLVFAREIASDPSLLIVSQPTRGVDLNGIAAIHTILRQFRAAGGAVLLVSEELEEILEISDRILVMAGGQIVGERQAAQTDITDIGKLMLLKSEAHV
ncbi:ABC transporter ATP-binding protein [Hoeflea prorocentri]|uniref:ATP-binding cassette domain-containing protein n=1 Tax=Hoeflea prorocentri TaxID=1922333 RepID=A0A9X3UJZ1_9HYPH|nr:ATP-binding cassette domain-containing protein [Hoeflea prorocentri]MCY6380196.1 ATP-binding cassette domain-containing protein [Hoeflea prorocentri]MDA5397996.1 ATP-binding cassette domain-containing protein [Hoeflea prorocentri]